MLLKKLTALLLALALPLGLAACGGKESGSDLAKDGEDGVIELSYWYSMDGTGGQIIEQQIANFNETIGAEKGIHVTGVYQDWPGTNALTAAMTTDDVDNMPDVIHMFSEYVSLIQDWDRTVWAEDYINAEDSQVSKDDLIPNTVAAYSINDKMIGVPFAISALLLYYRISWSRPAMTPLRPPLPKWRKCCPTWWKRLMPKTASTSAWTSLSLRISSLPRAPRAPTSATMRAVMPVR